MFAHDPSTWRQPQSSGSLGGSARDLHVMGTKWLVVDYRASYTLHVRKMWHDLMEHVALPSQRSDQMESEQERFTHTMDLLELEVAGLEQHEDLALVDRVSKLVGEIAGRITDAENKCELVVAAAWCCHRCHLRCFFPFLHQASVGGMRLLDRYRTTAQRCRWLSP